MSDLLDQFLCDKVSVGQAILFLGAGASMSAIGSQNQKPLTGNQLRDALCAKFLNGEEKSKPLVQVADYAKHEAGFLEVQAFIREQFSPLQPSGAHKIIPKFKWHSIFTTNYDLIVERAYETSTDRLQELYPIIRDGDQFSEAVGNPERVPYFKLHGCINTINDSQLPLILASEEYAKHKQNRFRLFSHLNELGREHPIIFCGYQLSDPNIQQIFFDLSSELIKRPSYALVDPGLGKFDIRMWQSRRVQPVVTSFEEFMNFLETKIPSLKRILGTIKKGVKKEIHSYLKHDSIMSEGLQNYLETELAHVFPGIATGGSRPSDFYKGKDEGWGGIKQQLDIKRRVCDQIIADALLDTNLKDLSLFLLKGHAGSGKTIALKRIAWNAACELGAPVVWVGEGAVLRPKLVHELATLCEERLLLVVDDAIQNMDDLARLITFCNQSLVKVSIVTCARNNEWNQYGENLERFITSEFEISQLSESEIDELVQKLIDYKCLISIKEQDKESLKRYFSLSSDRQLLVALHEATSGKPFEEIILDEYNGISPLEARILYMDVCTLNRLRVPVRAGVVSRISNINLEDFRKRFFGPLEHVVKVYIDKKSRDYAYVARHPLIAQFVFEHALKRPEEKAEQIARVIEYLNLDYSTDYDAFVLLIKGRTLADVFGDKHLAFKIYDAAEKVGAEPYFVWHQRAVFELNHKGCDTKAALSAIKKAEMLLPEHKSDKSILHTKAMVLKRLARESHVSLEIEQYRNEARAIFERLAKNAKDSRAHNGLAELGLDEIDFRLHGLEADDTDELRKRVFIESVKTVEDAIFKGLQSFPQDEYLLTRKADLANKLNKSAQAKQILELAFKSHLSSEFISLRLAKQHLADSNDGLAESVLRKGIEQNPNSKALHYELAKILISRNDPTCQAEVEHNLKRSFSPGDANFEAQLWFARHHYLYGDRQIAKQLFESLKQVRLSPKQKGAIQGEVNDSTGKLQIFKGRITSEHVSFCFIRSLELNDSVFAHESSLDEPLRLGLRSGIDVVYNLAFTMKGPIAINVRGT